MTTDTFKHPFFGAIPRTTGEFWTAQQRQMHSLHYVISYRASYKPELPDFFLEKYSQEGDIILDPFGGRGTTALQACLRQRFAISTDVNPLSREILLPKLSPVSYEQLQQRLKEINFKTKAKSSLDLSMFYHPDTEEQLLALRDHLTRHHQPEDRFIQLLALSRLHGHSRGFFSVYSFPQISITPEAQERINIKRKQKPDFRNVPELILRKAKSVLRDNELKLINKFGAGSKVFIDDASSLREVANNSIDLIITSPPFLNKADYLQDNWLELWFCGIDPEPFRSKLVMTSRLDSWIEFIKSSMRQMHRVLKPGAFAAIEVGEVMDGKTLLYLDETLVDIAEQLHHEGLRLTPEHMYIHQQDFTKLANCFKVDNNSKGTNTNRITVFRKE